MAYNKTGINKLVFIDKTWIDSVSLLPETPFVFSALFNDQELLFAVNYSTAEIFYRENESKTQDTRTVFIVSHCADEFASLSYLCWKFIPVLICTIKTLQTYRKSTLNFMLHWLGKLPTIACTVESSQAYPPRLMNRLFEKINLFIVVAGTSIKIQICIPAHIMNSYQSMFYQSSPVHLLLYAFVYLYKILYSKKVPQSISKEALSSTAKMSCCRTGHL